MADDTFPLTYHFDFSEGLNALGTYMRAAPHLGEGRPQRLGFSLDDTMTSTRLGVRLPPELADLIDFTAAISIADRRSPRSVDKGSPSRRSQSRRHLQVTIGVRRLSAWQRPEIQDLVASLLRILSHDDWDVRFVSRSNYPRPSEAQGHLFRSNVSQNARVVLHSGGMDSFLGLVGAIRRADAEAILAVSVISHPRIQKLTRTVIDSIGSGASEPSPMILGLELKLHHSALSRAFEERESSHRTRVLPCLAAGMVAAAMIGSNELRLTENGIGALNLPYTPGHSGAAMNRAVHPQTLHIFARLVSEVIGQPTSIVNDGLFLTKAQLLNERMSDSFLEALQRTASCERIPWILPHQPCGTCSSCLLRRMSLQAAGLLSANTTDEQIQVDVFSDAFDLHHGNAVPLMAFAAQAEELRLALDHVRPDGELHHRFPELARIDSLAASFGFSSSELRQAIVKLYRQHLREWDEFSRSIPAFGHTSLQLPLPLMLHRSSLAG